VEACTRKPSGSETDTAETEVDFSHIEEGFLVIDKQVMTCNPKGQSRRGTPRKNWRSSINKEVGTV
jgi:hypothetical protein